MLKQKIHCTPLQLELLRHSMDPSVGEQWCVGKIHSQAFGRATACNRACSGTSPTSFECNFLEEPPPRDALSERFRSTDDWKQWRVRKLCSQAFERTILRRHPCSGRLRERLHCTSLSFQHNNDSRRGSRALTTVRSGAFESLVLQLSAAMLRLNFGNHPAPWCAHKDLPRV